MIGCIFCKIIKKESPAKVVFEDDEVIAINDIAPKARIHILIIPKKHIQSFNHIEEGDRDLIGTLFLTAKQLAKELAIAETGYRLILDIGKDAGQTVDHLHLHLLGGEKLPWA